MDALPTTADELLAFRSIPECGVRLPRMKTTNPVRTSFQASINTQEAPPTTMQNLTSRIFKIERKIAEKITTYASVTAGIQSQNLFLYDKPASLKLVIRTPSIGKLPLGSLCSNPQQSPDHNVIPSLNRPQVLEVICSGLTPMDTISSSISILMVYDMRPSIIINNYTLHFNLLSEAEGFLIDGATFIDIRFSVHPVLKSQSQTSLLFPFP